MDFFEKLKFIKARILPQSRRMRKGVAAGAMVITLGLMVKYEYMDDKERQNRRYKNFRVWLQTFLPLTPVKWPSLPSPEPKFLPVVSASAADDKKAAYSPLPSREQQLLALGEKEFDVLVIGGGATGCGVALDAVSRGLKTAVIEKYDFGSGTSSRSTKLIHGGVRYLQKAIFNLDIEQYRMVKEALAERANLIEIAPHLAYPFPIMLPVYKYWQVPYFWVGIKMYDLVAGKQLLKSSYFLSKKKALELFPMLKKEKLKGALVYYDGQHDDARMNLSMAITAARMGGTVANYTEILDLHKSETPDGAGVLSGALVRDRLTGKEINVKAKCVINATGPYTDTIRQMDNPQIPKICQPSQGVHVVLPNYYSVRTLQRKFVSFMIELDRVSSQYKGDHSSKHVQPAASLANPEKMGLLDPATSDGRIIFFLPWQNVTLAGTTDNACDVTHQPAPTEQEIQFILNEVRNYLHSDVEVRRGDVLSAWCGIRPLVSDPNKTDKADTQSIARNHIIEVSKDKLITIAGGKWTTYRHMAEETVDRAVKECDLKPVSGCRTKGLLIDGGHGWSPTLFIRLVQDFGLENEVAKHLANTYGDKAIKVAKMATLTGKRWPVVGRRLHEEYPYLESEVRYAVREYACTAVDIIARRTRLAFCNVHAAEEALPRIIEILTEELKWSKQRQQEEMDRAKNFLRKEMGLDLGRHGVDMPINFTKDEINNYVKRFKSLDTDNKGYITVNDLRRYFKKIGEHVSEDQLHDILNEVDLNKNAHVDLGEFLQLMNALKKGVLTNSRLSKLAELSAKGKGISVERSGGGL